MNSYWSLIFCASMGSYQLIRWKGEMVYILQSLHGNNYHHIQSDGSVYDTGYDTKGFPKKIIPSQMVNDHNCKSTWRISPVQKFSIGLKNSIVEMSKNLSLGKLLRYFLTYCSLWSQFLFGCKVLARGWSGSYSIHVTAFVWISTHHRNTNIGFPEML